MTKPAAVVRMLSQIKDVRASYAEADGINTGDYLQNALIEIALRRATKRELLNLIQGALHRD